MAFKEFVSTLSQSHKRVALFSGMFLVLTYFVLPHIGYADFSMEGLFVEFVTGIISIVVSLVGGLLTLMIDALVRVALFSDFLDITGVRLGWTVVRDVGNMMLVMIFLVIAFGTVFKLQNLEYKNTLMKFFLMAILANFSYAFAGFMIDIAQIVMQTFVVAFQDTAASVLISDNALGIRSFLDLKELGKDVSTFDVMASSFAGIFFLIISTLTIAALVIILIARIIMIWILTVLSPLAFVLNILPNTSKYVAQWWTEWTKNLITGPVLAFFLWLAFTMIALVDEGTIINADGPTGGVVADPNPFVSGGFKTTAVVNYIIAIGLLMGGMMIAEQIGGAGGKFAGNMYQKSGAMLSSVGSFLGKVATSPARATLAFGSWGAAKVQASEVHDRLGGKTKFVQSLNGLDLNPTHWRKNISESMKKNRQQLDLLGIAESGAAMAKHGGKLGFLYGLGTPDIGRQYMTFTGFTNRFIRNRGRGRVVDQRQARLDEINAQLQAMDHSSDTLYEQEVFGDLSEDQRVAITRLKDHGNYHYDGRDDDMKTFFSSGDIGDKYMDYIGKNEYEKHSEASEWISDQIASGKDALVGTENLEHEISSLEQSIDALKTTMEKQKNNGEDISMHTQELAETMRQLKEKQQQRKDAEKIHDRSEYLESFQKPFLSAAERKRMTKELKKQQEDAEKTLQQETSWLPQNFEATAAFRTAMADAEKNIQTSNEYELDRMFKTALANGDRSTAAAVLLHAASVGHGNELIERNKGKDGKFYEASVAGFNKFINEKFIGDLGMDEQMAYMIQNDASERMERVNHWFGAQTNELKNGRWIQRTPEEHSISVSIQMSKANAQQHSRLTNRLGYMVEYVDDNGERQSRWTDYGLQQVLRIKDQFFANIAKDANKNALSHMRTGKNRKVLEDFLRSHFGDGEVVKDKTVDDILKEMDAIGSSDITKAMSDLAAIKKKYLTS